MKDKEIYDKVDESYERLVNDESIVSVYSLANHYGYGSKRAAKLVNFIYDKYGKNHVKSIAQKRRASLGGLANKGKIISEETKRKVSESNKKTWNAPDNEHLRIAARKSMIENCHPVCHEPWVREKAIETRRKRPTWAEYTKEGYESLIRLNKEKEVSDESKRKMSESAILRGCCLPEGFTHSDETKQRLSELTKERWESGFYTPNWQSKGHLELFDYLKESGYICEIEYLVGGKSYDIRVGDTLIEFNGTYWHYDPRFYDAEFYDKSKDRYAKDKWEEDELKKNIAIENGYNFITVWQYDFENNKEETIKKLIKNI